MAKNRYLNTKFWSDNYVSNLDPSEKLLFIYCLTNEHTNICGIYEAPVRAIAFDTGLDREMVIKILDRFAQDNKIHYIDGWIYVHNWIKHQVSNIKIEQGIKSNIELVPEKILAKIKQIDIDYGKPIDRLSIGPELLKLKLKLKSISCSTGGSPTCSSSTEKDFETFWQAYPRKVGKTKVRETFLKIENVKLSTMLAAIEEQKKSQQWQNAQFIPLPLTWLNQGRWEDETTVVSGSDPLLQEALDLIKECGGDKEGAMHKFAFKHSSAELLKYYHMFN